MWIFCYKIRMPKLLILKSLRWKKTTAAIKNFLAGAMLLDLSARLRRAKKKDLLCLTSYHEMPADLHRVVVWHRFGCAKPQLPQGVDRRDWLFRIFPDQPAKGRLCARQLVVGLFYPGQATANPEPAFEPGRA